MDHSSDKKMESVEWDPGANGPSLPMAANHANSKFGRVGFLNDGNMCYINTAIQVVVYFGHSSPAALACC